MASETSRAVTAAVQWVIVGIALGVLPTYLLVEERAKKDSAAAAAAAASAAASSVYAAWSATPTATCPPVVMQMPTVVAVAGNPAAPVARGPTRVGPTEKKDDVDDAKMLLPMLNMAQGMMGGDPSGGGGTPDMTEMMKNLPKK